MGNSVGRRRTDELDFLASPSGGSEGCSPESSAVGNEGGRAAHGSTVLGDATARPDPRTAVPDVRTGSADPRQASKIRSAAESQGPVPRRRAPQVQGRRPREEVQAGRRLAVLPHCRCDVYRLPVMTMTTLALGAALYFDYELASDPLPLSTLWSPVEPDRYAGQALLLDPYPEGSDEAGRLRRHSSREPLQRERVVHDALGGSRYVHPSRGRAEQRRAVLGLSLAAELRFG